MCSIAEPPPELRKVGRLVRNSRAWFKPEINDSRAETQVRVSAISTAWSRLVGFSINYAPRKMIFTSMITCVATSGHSALVPLESDGEGLEEVRMKLARRLLGTTHHRSQEETSSAPDSTSILSSADWVRA